MPEVATTSVELRKDKSRVYPSQGALCETDQGAQVKRIVTLVENQGAGGRHQFKVSEAQRE